MHLAIMRLCVQVLVVYHSGPLNVFQIYLHINKKYSFLGLRQIIIIYIL